MSSLRDGRVESIAGASSGVFASAATTGSAGVGSGSAASGGVSDWETVRNGASDRKAAESVPHPPSATAATPTMKNRRTKSPFPPIRSYLRRRGCARESPHYIARFGRRNRQNLPGASPREVFRQSEEHTSELQHQII